MGVGVIPGRGNNTCKSKEMKNNVLLWRKAKVPMMQMDRPQKESLLHISVAGNVEEPVAKAKKLCAPPIS